MENLFDALYQATFDHENSNHTTFFICGLFINTQRPFEGDYKILDIESQGGSALIFDNSDLMDFLKASGIDAATLYNELQTL